MVTLSPVPLALGRSILASPFCAAHATEVIYSHLFPERAHLARIPLPRPPQPPRLQRRRLSRQNLHRPLHLPSRSVLLGLVRRPRWGAARPASTLAPSGSGIPSQTAAASPGDLGDTHTHTREEVGPSPAAMEAEEAATAAAAAARPILTSAAAAATTGGSSKSTTTITTTTTKITTGNSDHGP